MKKIIAINGSPRKEWNTAQMLRSVLDGAAERGMATELVHLYDLDFRGCTSCFACKLKDGPSYGRCAMRDDLTPVLDAAYEADAIVLGSPIYFMDATGEMRSCMERLWFQSLLYTNPPASVFPRSIKTGLVYTMNVPEQFIASLGLDQTLEVSRDVMERTFGHCEMLFAADTLQFSDYSLYEVSYFKEEDKQRHHREEFPRDLERAHELGQRLAGA